MTKTEFFEVANNNGIYMASLMAAIAKVSITQVQLWVRAFRKQRFSI